jgi:GNAT superfamily N-acetyltransferase
MLPQGALADLVGFAEQQRLRVIHPEAQTVARLFIGRCSCDFVRPRLLDEREDERHLRERYRRLGVSRDVVIKALERHRRGGGLRQPREGWPRALASFIAEHARNAGPTLYYLQFSAEVSLRPPGEVGRLALAEVMTDPEGWLDEGKPTIVAR